MRGTFPNKEEFADIEASWKAKGFLISKSEYVNTLNTLMESFDALSHDPMAVEKCLQKIILDAENRGNTINEEENEAI